MNCGNFKGVSQIYTDTIYDSCQCSNGATWDGANTKCTCGSSGATWDEVIKDHVLVKMELHIQI